MMKDWANARQRVQDMKARDPKGSEKLNKEITSVSFDTFVYVLMFKLLGCTR